MSQDALDEPDPKHTTPATAAPRTERELHYLGLVVYVENRIFSFGDYFPPRLTRADRRKQTANWEVCCSWKSKDALTRLTRADGCGEEARCSGSGCRGSSCRGGRGGGGDGASMEERRHPRRPPRALCVSDLAVRAKVRAAVPPEAHLPPSARRERRQHR